MKIFSAIVKIALALAAVAGIVYVVANYGDKIVAWCKRLLNACPSACDGGCECCCDGECTCDGDCDVCLEQTEEAAEEAPVVDEAAPVADEADFEG